MPDRHELSTRGDPPRSRRLVLPLERAPGPADAVIVATDRTDGDLAIGAPIPDLDRRRRAIVDAPWTWLRQVHGAEVVVVRRAGDRAGAEGDGACTAVVGAPLAVQVADCAPVALVDPAGVVGVAHAGWRGLLAGIVERTVAAMADLGASSPVAVLGPCIRPASYEFGVSDLEPIVARYGESVTGRTTDGSPALDLPATVRAALGSVGVPVIAELGGCTAIDADLRWSHRARGDRQRQAMIVWMQARGSV